MTNVRYKNSQQKSGGTNEYVKYEYYEQTFNVTLKRLYFSKEKARAYKFQEVVDWSYSGMNYEIQKGSMVQFSLQDKQDAIRKGLMVMVRFLQFL